MSAFVVLNTPRKSYATSSAWFDAKVESQVVNKMITERFADKELVPPLAEDPMVVWHKERSIPIKATAETRSCETTRQVWSITTFEFPNTAYAHQFLERFGE